MCQEAFVYAGQLKFRLVSYIKTWPESCSNSNDHSLQPWQTEKHLRLHNMPNLESWYLSYCILPVHWTTLFILLWPFTSARHFCLQNCLTQDVFHTFLCRGVGVCVCEIPGDQRFLKYPNQSVWHQQPFHGRSHCSHVIPFLYLILCMGTWLAVCTGFRVLFGCCDQKCLRVQKK